jgi:hypothetical protein
VPAPIVNPNPFHLQGNRVKKYVTNL